MMNFKSSLFKFTGLIFRFLSMMVLFGFLVVYTVSYTYIYAYEFFPNFFFLDPRNIFPPSPLFAALLPLLITAMLTTLGHFPEIKRSCSRNQNLTYLVAAGLTLYLSATLLLLLFHLQTDTALDPSFLFLNIIEALPTVSILAIAIPIPAFITLTVFITICLWNGFRLILQTASANNGLHRILARVIILGMIAGHLLAPNELVAFFRQFYQEYIVAQKNSIHILYNTYYLDSISRNTQLPAAEGNVTEHLFILQLESLNAALVNPDVTPEMFTLARQNGLLITRLQGASVQTKRGQEAILCGTLPSLQVALMNSGRGRELHCLPQILREQGYKTFFFQSYLDLNFAGTGKFMKEIGFDEVYAAPDVMRPEDKRLEWGYQEDIFYQRVLEYLEKYRSEKIFVYIAVDSTNHYPFSNGDLPTSLRASLPFPAPQTFLQLVGNTTYAQDHYVGGVYRELFTKGYLENSHLLILGDHSFPIGLQESTNTFYKKSTWQENFVTSLAILPAKRSTAYPLLVGRQIPTLCCSQIDLLPTTLDLLGFKNASQFGYSFLTSFLHATALPHLSPCLVSVQPYSGIEIAVINYPNKLQFHLQDNKVTESSLDSSFVERVKATRKTTSADIEALSACLRSRLDNPL